MRRSASARRSETTGGELPARWVIHAATMVEPGGRASADVVRRATAATLWKAEELNVRSLRPCRLRHRRRRLPRSRTLPRSRWRRSAATSLPARGWSASCSPSAACDVRGLEQALAASA